MHLLDAKWMFKYFFLDFGVFRQMAKENVENLIQSLSAFGVRCSDEVDRIIMRTCGYPSVQVKICAHMARRGGTMLQRDIEALFKLSRPAISQTVDQMVSSGLIVRDGVERDKRLKRISLTDYGTSLAKKVNQEVSRFQRSLASKLDASQQEQLALILEALSAAMEDGGDKGII